MTTYSELKAQAIELNIPYVGVKQSDLQAKIANLLATQAAEANVTTEPIPTGKLGGNGQFYCWPDGVFAPMVNGKQSEPSFDQATWDLVSPALPSVNVAKSTVIKAMEKKAEIKVNKYRINITIDFDPQWVEDQDDLSGNYSLTEAVGLLDRCGHNSAASSLTDALDNLKVTITAKGSKGSGKGHIGGTTDRFNRPDISVPVESYKIKPVTSGSSAHTCLLALMEGAGKDQERVNEIAAINGSEPYDTKKQAWKVRQVIAQTGYGLSSDGYLVFPDGMTQIRTK